MSTETETLASSETTIVTPVAAPVVAVPIAAQPPIAEPAKPGAKVEITSDKLAERFSEERRKAIEGYVKSLGLPNEEAVKAAVTEHKRLESEKMSDLEKRDAQIKDLAPKAQRAAELESIVKAMADEQEAALTPEMRAAVDQLGGDDPARRLGVIKALRSAVPAAPLAAPPAVRPPVVAPANTAPSNSAPPVAANNATVDHLAVLKSLEGNPVRHQGYLARHRDAIVAARKARGEYAA